MSLWGPNSFLVWFGMEEFNGINDPKAQAMLARLRALLKIVKDLGLNVSLGCICNEGYANSPASLRADDSTVNHPGYHADVTGGNRIYQPWSRAMSQQTRRHGNGTGLLQREVQCIQRHRRGLLVHLALRQRWLHLLEMRALGRQRLSAYGGACGTRVPPRLPQWESDIVARGTSTAGPSANGTGSRPSSRRRSPTGSTTSWPTISRITLAIRWTRACPGGLPLLNFPDISMYGQYPWGGYGANPHPGRLQKRWDETKRKLSGGFPYSEGIYEDLNKVICTRLYWEPDRPAIETVRDYAAFEFSPEVADDVTSVVKLFEENHFPQQDRQERGHGLRVDRACRRQADAAGPQLLAVAALLHPRGDRPGDVPKHQGQGREKVFRQAYEELMKISHAENAMPMLRPALIPADHRPLASMPQRIVRQVSAGLLRSDNGVRHRKPGNGCSRGR